MVSKDFINDPDLEGFIQSVKARKECRSARVNDDLDLFANEIDALRRHQCTVEQVIEWLATHKGVTVTYWSMYRYIKKRSSERLSQPQHGSRGGVGSVGGTKTARMGGDIPSREKNRSGGDPSGLKGAGKGDGRRDFDELPMRPKGNIDEIWAELNVREGSLLAGEID